MAAHYDKSCPENDKFSEQPGKSPVHFGVPSVPRWDVWLIPLYPDAELIMIMGKVQFVKNDKTFFEHLFPITQLWYNNKNT